MPKIKNPAIEAIIANIEKQMGDKGVIVKYGDMEKEEKQVLSFGYPEVDEASNCGGIARGKIIEIFGPESGGKSYLSLKLIASTQKQGFHCCLVDAEQSFDPTWAKKHGVNVDDLYIINKGMSAEKMLDYVNAMCKSGGFALVVVDSTAALIPEKELTGSIGDQDYALLARAMSKACRKIIQSCGDTKTTCVFINQIREKMNVVFGCFHYTARVVLEDGTTKKIGTIVNNKLDLKVMSYNKNTGAIEPKKIIGWHDNGNLKDNEFFLQIIAEKHGKNGITNISCTPNHIVFKCDGYDVDNKRYIGNEVCAEDLEIGDEILSAQPLYLTEDQMQVVYGSMMGDGSLRFTPSDKDEEYCAQLRIGHGYKQRDYAKWKQEILNNVVSYIEDKDDKYCFDTISMWETGRNLRYRNDVGKNRYCVIPKEVSEKMDVLGLAIWYLDDGSFSGHYSKWGKGQSVIYSTKFANREIMLPTLKKLGLIAKIQDRGFVFDAENTEKLHNMICKYVPPCMEYKLHPKFRGKYSYIIDDELSYGPIKYEAIPIKIIDIYEKPETKTKRKFDLTIEDNATYLIDGAIVHNSPETTPGGRALKFYSHQRISVTPGRNIKIMDNKKEKVVARKSWVKFIKNKVAAPMGSCEIEIIFFEEAMSPVVKLCNIAKDYKLIGQRDGQFQIKKDVINEKKNLDTGMTTVVELADYVVKNNFAKALIDAYVKAATENQDKIDKTIQSMIDDSSLIISPLAGKEVKVEEIKNDEKLVEIMNTEDDGNDKIEPDEV